MNRTLTTRQDVTAEITEALGEHAAAHDVDRIADACFEYNSEAGRFEQIVDTDGFWAEVEEAAL